MYRVDIIILPWRYSVSLQWLGMQNCKGNENSKQKKKAQKK